MPAQVADVTEIAFGDLADELKSTRRVLERVPDGKFDWRPHEKSFTLGALAQHVAALPMMIERIVAADALDYAKWQRPPETKTTAQLLKLFDEAAAAALQAVSELQPAALSAPWTFGAGEQVYFRAPRAAALRSFAISHLIHHRAQLTMYLRLLNVPIPGLYGPSADEQ